MSIVKEYLEEEDFTKFKQFVDNLLDINEPSEDYGCFFHSNTHSHGGFHVFYTGFTSDGEYERIYEESKNGNPYYFKWNLMQLVCAYGYDNFLLYLLEKGAEDKFQDFYGRDAVQIASHCSNHSIIDLIHQYPYSKSRMFSKIFDIKFQFK